MSKKLIILSIVLLLILFGGYTAYNTIKAKSTQNLIDASIKLGENYLGVYSDNVNLNTIDRKYVTEKVVESIDKFHKDMKNKNNAYLNMEVFIDNYREDEQDEVKPSLDVSKAIEVDTGNPQVNNDVPEEISVDPRVKKKGDKYIVYLKDLDINKEGLDVIEYRGYPFTIDMTFDMLTYDKIKTEPSYLYKYSTSKLFKESGKQFIDIIYVSRLNSVNNRKIRCTVEKNKIVDIKAY